MAVVFFSLLTLASPLMDVCRNGLLYVENLLTSKMAAGDLKGLTNDGIFAEVDGVGVKHVRRCRAYGRLVYSASAAHGVINSRFPVNSDPYD